VQVPAGQRGMHYYQLQFLTLWRSRLTSLLLISTSGPIRQRDRDDQTWGPFIAQIERRGFRLLDTQDRPDAMVAINWRDSFKKMARKWGLPRSRRVLVQWESPVIQPSLFSPHNTQVFSHVLSMSPLWPGASQRSWVRWPQGQDWSAFALSRLPSWEHRHDHVAMLNRNVISANSRSTYHLRRQLAGYEGSRKVVLAGHGWPTSLSKDLADAGRATFRQVRQRRAPSGKVLMQTLIARPSSAMGGVESKSDFLGQFRYALVIENSLDYVSEKLFGALAAGCVPIYVGPPLTPFGLDDDLVIRAPASASGVHAAIEGISGGDVERVMDSRREFLATGLRLWLPQVTMSSLADRICDYFESSG
jgi:hypothetical protein